MTTLNDVLAWVKSAAQLELRTVGTELEKEIRAREQSALPSDAVITFTDGASRGNPGLAGAGILLFNSKEEKLKEDCQFLGVCTNNEAEYRALIAALKHAQGMTKGIVRCYLDSQLTVRQLNGEYALKSEKLTPFFHEVKNLMRHFQSVSFHHVPREHPQLQMADKLANKAIDTRKER